MKISHIYFNRPLPLTGQGKLLARQRKSHLGDSRRSPTLPPVVNVIIITIIINMIKQPVLNSPSEHDRAQYSPRLMKRMPRRGLPFKCSRSYQRLNINRNRLDKYRQLCHCHNTGYKCLWR